MAGLTQLNRLEYFGIGGDTPANTKIFESFRIELLKVC